MYFAAVQIPLSGYGGRSELYIRNLPLFTLHNDLYHHSIRVSSACTESTLVSVVVGNRGNQVAFVNALAFKGIQLIHFLSQLKQKLMFFGLLISLLYLF